MPGKTLYIPAYWWYSIKFNDNTSISCFNYRTYMNNLAILPYICLHALQIQNVKRDVVKKVSINELNNKEIIYPVDKQELENTEHISHSEHNHEEYISNESTDINNLPEPASTGDNIGSALD